MAIVHILVWLIQIAARICSVAIFWTVCLRLFNQEWSDEDKIGIVIKFANRVEVTFYQNE
jgi:hypothetical protein